MRHRNPYAGQSYSKCQTCGLDKPSNLVWLNPRFGWQCLDCWDGLVHRDQIQYPIFPNEGTRRTPAPLTNTLLEGISGTGTDTLHPTYVYPLIDRRTGQVYSASFVPFHVNASGAIVYETSAVIVLSSGTTSNLGPFRGLRANNGWVIIVVNGALATMQDDGGPGILNGACDFGDGTPASGIYYLYDRTDLNLRYRIEFATSPGVISVVLDPSNPAHGGIRLNSDGSGGFWNFYINGGTANYDNAAFPDLLPWDNSHQFFVDNTTGVLNYVP